MLFARKTPLFFLLMLMSMCCSAAPIDHFVTTWKTDNPGTSNSTSITIPTTGTGYSYSVDWDNDNIVDVTGVTGDITHDFGVAGTYTIRIFGDFPRIYFNNSGDKDKIISIDQWGTNPWTSMSSAFFGATNLINNATDTPDLSGVNNLNNMFRSAHSVGDSSETANWNWDTSQILTMNATFHSSIVFNQDISGWNTDAVIDMGSMFFNALLFNQDISTWGTAEVQFMNRMFLGAFDFNQNLAAWNVENVTDFTQMFSLVTLSNTNYDALLISWAEQNINNALSFDGGVSQYCSHEARVARLSLALEDSLSIVDGGLCDEGFFTTTWKTDNPGTSNSTSITIPTKDGEIYFYRVDWNGDGDFDDSGENIDYTADATHDYGVAGTYTIRIKGIFPRIHFNDGGDKQKILSVDQWGTRRFETMALAFTGASNLTINAADTPAVESGGGYFLMFSGASSIGLGNGNWDWNTENIDNMRSMFRNTQFNEDISSWHVSNVSEFIFMFQNAELSTSNYDALLTGWNTQNLQPGLIFGGGNSTYCSQGAQDARANMISNDGWTINDGGLSPTCDDEIDIVVAVLNFADSVEPGELVEYIVQVVNIGSNEVVNANMVDVLPPELIASSWVCTPLGTATCGSSGMGEINDIFSIPLDGASSVTYTVSATVTSNPFTQVYYQAIATANPAQLDVNESNNMDDDLNVFEELIFQDGFEEPMLVVKASKGFLNFDLNTSSLPDGLLPSPIAKGLDDNGQTVVWVHTRKDNDLIQLRTSTKIHNEWVIGSWYTVDKNELITVKW